MGDRDKIVKIACSPNALNVKCILNTLLFLRVELSSTRVDRIEQDNLTGGKKNVYYAAPSLAFSEDIIEGLDMRCDNGWEYYSLTIDFKMTDGKYTEKWQLDFTGDQPPTSFSFVSSNVSFNTVLQKFIDDVSSVPLQGHFSEATTKIEKRTRNQVKREYLQD